jgi:hypothetical protein
MPAASGASGPTTVACTFSRSAIVGQRLDVRQRQVFQFLFARRAGIAWRDIDFLQAWRLRQAPGQCMLAAAGADYQDSHARLVAEVAEAGEYHGQVLLVGGGNDFGIAHRAAGLDHRGSAGLGQHVEAIAEGEEGVRSGH